MSTSQLPSTIRTWQYSTSCGGIEKHMKIKPTTPMPTRKPDQHLAQIIACALNPVDHKTDEIGLVDKVVLTKPATPGIDFSGRIVTPASGSGFTEGQLVFGCAGNRSSLAEPYQNMQWCRKTNSPHFQPGSIPSMQQLRP
jgi:NADPH:quinone reductase-like Zn-dependent oxidoreductase